MSVGTDFIYFAAFDDAQNLLYTKFNFEYGQYALDFGLPPPVDSYAKIGIFKDFMKKNGTTYETSYSVKDEYVKYFFPITADIITYMTTYGYSIHVNYMHTVDPPTYLTPEVLVEQQFDLIYYTDNEIQRLQDYFFTTSETGKRYSKYNFQFDLYSNDFKVYGSKLFIFTDFVVRCIYNSGVFLGFFGYGLPRTFEKYFADVEGLDEYLIQYGVTSIYDVVYKNVNNINWESYKKMNPDLNPDATVQQLIDHYYLYGQFELRKFEYNVLPNPKNSNILNSIAAIYGIGSSEVGTGFLYSNIFDYDKVYLVTCYHLVASNTNKTTIRASLSYQDVNDELKQPETVVAEFLIIGYDRGSDILIAVFDPTLPWNVSTNANISKFVPLTIDIEFESKKGDAVTIFGNAQNKIPEGSFTGFVIDDNYAGPFVETFEVGRPTSYLVNVYGSKGMSGGPLFTTDSNGVFKLIGMVNSYPEDMPQYTQAIKSFLLSQIIQNAIYRYAALEVVYANDFEQLQYQLQFPIGVRWLGTICEYYNTSDSRFKYKQLYNFSYMGGLIIRDFILGFNPVTRRYVTEYNGLSDKNIIKINSPLLKTNIYKRFLRSSMVPIVIKSLTFYDGIDGTFQEYYLGKYGNQVGLGVFSYGYTPVGSYRNADVSLPYRTSNTSHAKYLQLKIKYFYNNGVSWIEDEEEVVLDENYVNITENSLGEKYMQNVFDFPLFLAPYRKPYYDVMRDDALGYRSDLYWNNESSILGKLDDRFSKSAHNKESYSPDQYEYGSGSYAPPVMYGSGSYGPPVMYGSGSYRQAGYGSG